MANPKLNLFQKIADVKANIEGFTKDKKSYQYSYVSGSQVLHRIREKMIEHNLLLFPETSEETYEQITFTRFNKKMNRDITATEYIVKMNLKYTWINADNPEEKLTVDFYAVGQQDDVSKAHGTALTYAERYFLLKFFGIPTDEDDADAKQKKEMYSAPKPVTSEMIGQFKANILKFAQMNNTDEQGVKDALNIMDYAKLSATDIENHTNTLKGWGLQ